MLSFSKNLIFKIIITILFVCLFLKLSDSNSKMIRFNSFYINSSLWMIILIISIIVFKSYDKYLGTLLFILIFTYYRKFMRDPFAIKETFQENKNRTGNLEYATNPTRIGYTLSLYPPKTTSPN